jgi:hypothetical protein
MNRYRKRGEGGVVRLYCDGPGTSPAIQTGSIPDTHDKNFGNRVKSKRAIEKGTRFQMKPRFEFHYELGKHTTV